MKTIVQKYGGSSLADVSKVRAVAQQIAQTARQGVRVVAVVSAMGKTTDGLMQLAHEVSTEPDRRELDMLLTAGERIAMALVAMAVRAEGLPATSLTGSQCGILTSDAPGGARIVEVRPFRVQDALDQGHVVIVAGFQGVSWRREVTTLGRGGSDTTAVALAAALGGDCEIYSDVAGIYTADPRVVSDAQHLPDLGHDETLELARAGAKVLAADAVAMARMHGIALYARSTSGGPQTHVRVDAPVDRAWISAVACRPNAVLLTIDADSSLLTRIETVLEDAGVAPLLWLAGTPAQLLLARDVADAVDPAFDKLVARLQELASGRLRHCLRGTLVSAVGPGVGREPGLPAKIRAAAATVAGTADAPLLAHGMTLSLLVSPAVAADLARALHDGLLGSTNAAAKDPHV